MTHDPGEMWTVLARREAVLHSVPSSGTATKTELTAVLDVSRSTVDRALGELRRVGYVVDAADGYRRTVVGSLALTAYDRMTAQVENVWRSREVLSTLPADAPLSPAMLDGADAVTPDADDPDRARAEVVDLFDRATRVRAFGPVVVPQTIRDVRELIVEGDLTVQALLTEGFVEHLFSRYGEALRSVVATDRFELRQTDALPYTLVVAQVGDGYEAAVAVPDGNDVKALLRNDADDAVAWACEVFEDRWLTADRLTESPYP